MRIGFHATLAVLLSIVAAFPSLADAQEGAKNAPVLIVTLSKIDELFGDFSYITEAVGFPQFGQMGTMMAGQFTAGLDTTKPIGVVVSVDEGEMKPLVMLPIKDLEQFLASLEGQFGEPKDAGDGILELAGPVPVYLKEKDGWAFVTASSDDMDRPPANPLEEVEKVAGKYDIAIRGLIQNIPSEYREMALLQMREGVELQMDNLPESDDTEAQKKMIENALKQYEDLIAGLDQITIGIGIEEEGQKVVIDTNMTSVPGTKLARQVDLLNNLKSRFGGFLMGDAAVTMHSTTKMLPEDAANTAASIDSMMPTVIEGIDDNDDMDEETKAALKKLAGTLAEVLSDTVRNGEFDSGMSVLLDETFAVIGGMAVADGAKVESAIKDAASSIKSDKVKFDLGVDQHAGVRMHTLSVPIPDDEEDAQKFLGDTLDITFGVAEKSVYVAAGEKGMTYLRQAIDASAGAAGKNVMPMRMRISVAKIMNFVHQYKDDEIIAAVCDELEKVGEDQGIIMLLARPTPGGAQYHFELREGVLRAIGRGINASQQGQAAPAGF